MSSKKHDRTISNGKKFPDAPRTCVLANFLLGDSGILLLAPLQRCQAMAVASAVSLCTAVREMIALHQYAEVCEKQEEIAECITTNADEKSSGALAYCLSKACSATGQHAIAVKSMELALSIERKVWEEECRRVSEGIENNDAEARTRIFLVYNGLGRANTAIGNYVEAELCFKKCVSLRSVGAGSGRVMVPCLLELANSMHALQKYDEAIPLLRALLRTMDAEDSGDEENEINNLNTPEHYILSVCPTALLARCLAAVGRYQEALVFFLQARKFARQQRNITCVGDVELDFAVVLWAKQVCIDRAMAKLAKSYRNNLFIGPTMTPEMLEKHTVQFATRAAVSVFGQAGSANVNIQLNAEAKATAVRMAERDVEALPRLMTVQWDAFVPSPYGNPDTLVLKFKMQDLPEAVFTSVKDGVFVSTELCVYLQECIRYSQVEDTDATRKSMAIVVSSLLETQQIASTFKLSRLLSDSTIFLSFAFLALGGTAHRDFAVQSLKDCLQAEVESDMVECHWCFEQASHMEICGGCRAVRFCNKTHQRLASKPAFGNVSFRHRDLCPMLKICKMLHQSDDATESARLLVLYDEAINKFLRMDIFTRYEQNYDLRRDAQDAHGEDN